jgi:hypothetical protein
MTQNAAPFRIAVHCAQSERGAWSLALDKLNTVLSGNASFAIDWAASSDALAADVAPIMIFSLLPDLCSARPWEDVAATWHSLGRRLQAGAIAKGSVVFVTTILRHLPQEQRSLMRRLRQLNMLAAELSQRSGLLLIDLDRVLAHQGAAVLRTNARLDGEAGQIAAAEAIVTSLLGYGLAAFVEDETLDAAIAAHGAKIAARQTRLSLRTNQMLERQQVGRGVQVFLKHWGDFDFGGRSFAGLVRDLKFGRIGHVAFARQVARKIVARLRGLRA